MTGVRRDIGRNGRRRAMTLIELICVLGLLSVVVTLAAPSLSPFFRGRRLDEEARRMLALTRYARSEAISRCVPMELWVDSESGAYGLTPQAGYEFDDGKKAIEFQLGDQLQFVIDSQMLVEGNTAKVVFLPDGTIDEELSEAPLESFLIQDTSRGEALEILRSETGMGYEIRRAIDASGRVVVNETQGTAGRRG
jgi:prepilin-type N-terminal cleavage/methylation domain-containing protein